MNYLLREMTLDDIDEVIEGETLVFGESLGYDMLYTELKFNPYAYYFVLEIRKHVAGYIGVWIEPDHSEIINFYILEKYRRLGFGTMIIDFIINLVRDSHVPNISLEVRESNTIAIKLYEKFGFKFSHKRVNYYSNHEDALVMILEVNKC